MVFKVAIFSLNQWALDFAGNTQRIIKSIDLAHQAGAIYRAGPELELCGYSLEDAFFEKDTVDHCWSCLGEILKHSRSLNLIIDVGMPVHFSSLYNCRVLIYRGHILCIRAKTSLARDGIYRESRHFKEWPAGSGLVPFRLPSQFAHMGQEYVPMGANFILEVKPSVNYPCDSFRIGWEICQELWDTKNVSADLYHQFGCHMVINGSASYWELRKLNTVTDMIKGISLRAGACYAFSNLVGCDGQRFVLYGQSCIYDRGNLVAMTPTQDKLFDEVQMITHTVNPRNIDEYRAQMGIRPDLAHRVGPVWDLLHPPKDTSQMDSSYKVLVLKIAQETENINRLCTNPQVPVVVRLSFQQEIYYYVSLWLWDYLRRSGMKGFMMPLSGGLDSSTVAMLVYAMCNQVHKMLDNCEVRKYFQRCHNIGPEKMDSELASPEAICRRILKCRYISTENSSQATEERARLLCKSIGAQYSSVSIQDIYNSCRQLEHPEFEAPVGAGHKREVTLLDQNIQARLRMVVTYYLSGGDRIVLATGNVDEGIMGYLTKYDCSSADLNPIGSLCKEDLKSFLKYCCTVRFNSNTELVAVLEDIISAPPSAELTGSEQRDEDEIGITYEEISVLGKVRRGIYGCSGPKGAFETVWINRNNPPFCTKIRCLKKTGGISQDMPGQMAQELSNLIKRFYQRYTRNRHKLTVLTPALHAESYSPDDNRFDHRQFLYPSLDYQFKCIDEMVDRISNPTKS